MGVCPYNSVHYFPGWCGVQNWLFCLKIESSRGSKDTVTTMREADTMSEVLAILLIHLREVNKPSRSNGCLSLHHSVIFSRLMWFPKLVHLLEDWEFLW